MIINGLRVEPLFKSVTAKSIKELLECGCKKSIYKNIQVCQSQSGMHNSCASALCIVAENKRVTLKYFLTY